MLVVLLVLGQMIKPFLVEYCSVRPVLLVFDELIYSFLYNIYNILLT